LCLAPLDVGNVHVHLHIAAGQPVEYLLTPVHLVSKPAHGR